MPTPIAKREPIKVHEVLSGDYVLLPGYEQFVRVFHTMPSEVEPGKIDLAYRGGRGHSVIGLWPEDTVQLKIEDE